MKYKNIKTTLDGIVFDSRKEANRYAELKLLERGGLIRNLELQKRIELLPSLEVIDRQGKTVERAIHYVADFVYWDIAKEQEIIEDVKGVKPPVYKLKKRLLRQLHNKIILET